MYRTFGVSVIGNIAELSVWGDNAPRLLHAQKVPFLLVCLVEETESFLEDGELVVADV